MTQRKPPLAYAGSLALDADNPHLERAAPSALLFVPARVDVGGEYLWWETEASTTNRGKQRAPGRGLLEGFAGLYESSNSDLAIRDYARKWGALYICTDHGLPTEHDSSHHCRPGHWANSPRPTGVPENAMFWEPLAAWRQFSGQAAAILRLADAHNQGSLGTRADWKTVYAKSGRTAPWWRQDVNYDRRLLAGVLNEWLLLGAVQLGLGVNASGGLTVEFRLAGAGSFSSMSLFGAIAMQLMLAVANTRGWATCSECGQMFDVGQRRPRSDRRRYCGRCGKRAAWRYAQAKRRAARRETPMRPGSAARNPRSKR